MNKRQEKIVILDNVRSALNVGAIFRTGSALGVTRIYLCGITPTPFDPKGKKRRDFVKTALGSEDEIVWEHRDSIPSVIAELKERDVYIIGIEQDERSVDYKEMMVEDRATAFIVGSEVEGIQQGVRTMCDQLVEIPMLGLKESLNVTIAFAIVGFFRWDR